MAEVAKKPKPKTESLMDRLDALAVGLLISFLCVYALNSTEFVRRFDHSQLPFANEHPWTIPIVAIGVYLAFVHGVQSKKEDATVKEPSSSLLNTLLKYWNLFLTLLSLIMLIGIGLPVLKFGLENGPLEAICDSKDQRWKGPGFFFLAVFAYSKYAELLDTAFLIIRRRPVSFLHWYHHCTVLAYSWFACIVKFSPGYYFAIVNCFVHTIMYWYYYRRASGVFLSYDKFITVIQMAQMVLGVIVTGVWTFLWAVAPAHRCHNSHAVAAIGSGVVMYASYFYLFYKFFRSRYSKGQKGGSASKEE